MTTITLGEYTLPSNFGFLSRWRSDIVEDRVERCQERRRLVVAGGLRAKTRDSSNLPLFVKNVT